LKAYEVFDRELERLHKELNTFVVDDGDDNTEYRMLLEYIDKVNRMVREIALTDQQMNRGGLLRSEVKLAIAWMKKAAQEFSNHGSNDIPKEILELLSKEEWDILEKKYQEFNKTPHEYEPGRITHCDAAWMSYLAKRLEALL
jgi:hypothetical protein